MSERSPDVLAVFREIDAEIDEDLDGADDLVCQFRAKYMEGPWSSERAWLAMRLARTYFKTKDFEEARIWVLRALYDGPRIDAMCLLGDIFDEEGHASAAMRWYEAACAMSEPAPAPSSEPQPRYAYDDLVANRERRLAGIRRAMYQEPQEVRSVGRLVHPGIHVLAVQTAPRSSPTFASLYGEIQTQGWRGPKLIVADAVNITADGLEVEADGWATRSWWEGGPVGSVRAFLRLLEDIVVRWPQAETVTVLEDDVRLARGALDYIWGTDISEVAFVSWFAADLPLPGPRLAIHPSRHFSGSQALTIPMGEVLRILRSPIGATWPVPHLKDGFIREAVGLDRPYGIHHPHLVQHIGGLSSAIGNDRLGPRVSRDFVDDVAGLAVSSPP